MFEKKQIDPNKYTMDLLCDFIYDKAKKMYAKIEQLQEFEAVQEQQVSFFYN